MLDINWLKDNTDKLQEILDARNSDVDIEAVLAADKNRKSLLNEIEELRHKKKETAKQVGLLKREGKPADEEMTKAAEYSKALPEREEKLRDAEEEYRALMLTIPNVLHESVPHGKDEADNRFERDWGEKPEFDFEPKPHDELAEELGIIDFQRAAKITGSRFAVLAGAGARLERALINFMLDIQTKKNGYTEMMPPFIVNENSLTGTGQLPKFGEDLFKLNYKDYYLIPTAEVPVTNYFADEILDEQDLPFRFTAFTPCFRSEAGSYGQDTKGLIRQHQFNKVELVTFSHPDKSWEELENLTADAETVLRELGLHYRVMTLCSGDVGFSASKTYDLEVWLPSQDTYREISSCSNFTDFQARRAMIRFKDRETRKNRYIHTLNGSGLAVGRTAVAIMENYQQKDGSILIPEKLRPYMNGEEIIRQGI